MVRIYSFLTPYDISNICFTAQEGQSRVLLRHDIPTLTEDRLVTHGQTPWPIQCWTCGRCVDVEQPVICQLCV